MPSAPVRTSGGSRPRIACPATDESARQGGVPDLEGTRGIHPHRPRRGASRPAVVVAPDDRTAANVLSPPGYRIRQEGWKKAAIRLTVLKASVRHTDVSSRRSVFCSGPLDLRAQAEVASVLRPDTPPSAVAVAE